MVVRTVIVSCHGAWGLKGTTASWAGGGSMLTQRRLVGFVTTRRWWGIEHTMKKG